MTKALGYRTDGMSGLSEILHAMWVRHYDGRVRICDHKIKAHSESDNGGMQGLCEASFAVELALKRLPTGSF